MRLISLIRTLRRFCCRYGAVAALFAAWLSSQTSVYAAEFIPLGAIRLDASSADGGVLVGRASSSAFRWTKDGGMAPLPNSPGTGGVTVSADGSTVAWRDGLSMGGMWSESGGYQALNGMEPLKISAHGSLIVGKGDSGPATWTAQAGVMLLSNPFGSGDGDAYLISGDESVIAGRIRGGGPFRWTESNGTVDLGRISGHNSTEVIGMSDDGSTVIGTSHFFESLENQGPRSIWRWTGATGLVLLEEGTVNAAYDFVFAVGADFSGRRYVSAGGNVISGFRHNSDRTIAEAFRWTDTTGPVVIPGLGVSTQSIIQDMSADGNVLLGITDLSGQAGPPREYWFWTEKTGTVPLTEVFAQQGLSEAVAGWNFSSALATSHEIEITDDGRAIFGGAINPNGVRESFIMYLGPLVIPEPSSRALLISVLVGITLLQQRRVRRGVVAFTAVAAICTTFATGHAAEFIPLGFLDNTRPYSVVTGASADGSVVVGYSAVSGGNEDGFRWTRDGGMMQLLSDRILSPTPIVSADGSTVAWREALNTTKLWSQSAGYQTIDNYDAVNLSTDGSLLIGTGTWTAETGIEVIPNPLSATSGGFGNFVSNDKSVIAGLIRDSNDGLPKPFRWTESGGTVDLGRVPGDTYYTVDGMSDDGSTVIGESFFYAGPGTKGPTSIWRWTAETGLLLLEQGTADADVIFRFDGNEAYSQGWRALSADGTVIAGYRRLLEAFRWTEATGIENFPELEGSSRSAVWDMSADGSVILGASDVGISETMYSAWLWTEATGTRAVSDIITEQGLAEAIADWDIKFSTGLQITDDGNALIGTGTNPDGNTEAYVIYLDPLVIPGDFNTDGTVDAADYVVWRKGLATGAYTEDDYNTWRTNFGTTTAGAAAVANSSLQSPVPEPASAALVLFAAAGLLAAPLRWRLRPDRLIPPVLAVKIRA